MARIVPVGRSFPTVLDRESQDGPLGFKDPLNATGKIFHLSVTYIVLSWFTASQSGL